MRESLFTVLGVFESVFFGGPSYNKVVCHWHVYVTFRNFTVAFTGGTCIGRGSLMVMSW